MSAKYEVIYWDYIQCKEITEKYTNSFIEALWLVYKLEKKYHCVSIKFRRDRVVRDNFLAECDDITYASEVE